MKQFTKRILGNITAILLGALGGFSVVRSYLDSNPYFLIPTIPTIFYIIYLIYKIYIGTKKIKKIEKDFKDKYGFDTRDKDAFNKYLDKIGKEEK